MTEFKLSLKLSNTIIFQDDSDVNMQVMMSHRNNECMMHFF